jgi:hypothetical protein
MKFLPEDDSTAGRMVAHIKSPFATPTDVATWMWLALFVMIMAFLWNNVLRHIVTD